MAEIADFELEKTRKACIEAVRDFEAMGTDLAGQVQELVAMIDKLFQMDFDESKKHANELWEMYLCSSLNLAGYFLDRFEIDEPEIQASIRNLKHSIKNRWAQKNR